MITHNTSCSTRRWIITRSLCTHRVLQCKNHQLQHLPSLSSSSYHTRSFSSHRNHHNHQVEPQKQQQQHRQQQQQVKSSATYQPKTAINLLKDKNLMDQLTRPLDHDPETERVLNMESSSSSSSLSFAQSLFNQQQHVVAKKKDNIFENDEHFDDFDDLAMKQREFKIYIHTLMRTGRVEQAVSHILSRYGMIRVELSSDKNGSNDGKNGQKLQQDKKFIHVPSYETYELLLRELARVNRYDIIKKVYNQIMDTAFATAPSKKSSSSSTSSSNSSNSPSSTASNTSTSSEASSSLLSFEERNAWMIERGIDLRPTHAFLSEMLRLSLRYDLDNVYRISSLMDQLGMSKTDGDYLTLLQYHVRLHEVDSASRLLKEMQSKNESSSMVNLRTVDQMYAMLLEMYFSNRMDQMAWSLFEQYKRRYKYPSRRVSATVLRHVAVDLFNVDHARSLTLQLPRNVLSELHFINLIHAYVKVGRYHDALNVIGTMKSMGFVPSPRSFTPMLSHAAHTGSLKKLDELIDMMIADHLIRDREDIYVMAFRMNALMRQERTVEAEQLYIKTLDKGIAPPLGVFLTMFAHYLQVRNYDRVRALISDYKRLVGPLNPLFFGYMIYDKFRDGDRVAIAKLMDEMRNCGFPLTSVHFRLVLNGAARYGDGLHDLDETLELMEELGLQLTYPQAVMILHLLCLFNSLESAREFFERIPDFGFQHSSLMYQMMIGFHMKFGEIDMAHSYFDRMIAEDVKPSPLLYQTMVHYYRQLRMYEDAEAVYQAILENKMKPTDKALQSMFHIQLRKHRDPESAYEYYKQISKDFNLVSYPSMIQKLFNRFIDLNLIDQAEEMISELKKGGEFVAGPKMYEAVIRGYEKNGRIHEKRVKELIQAKHGVIEQFLERYSMPTLQNMFQIPVANDYLPHNVRIGHIVSSRRDKRMLMESHVLNTNYYFDEDYEMIQNQHNRSRDLDNDNEDEEYRMDEE